MIRSDLISYLKPQVGTESQIITQSLLNGCFPIKMTITLSMTKGYTKITSSIFYPDPTNLKHFLMTFQWSLSVKKIQFHWGDIPVMRIPVKPAEIFKLVLITLQLAITMYVRSFAKALRKGYPTCPSSLSLNYLPILR